jgi:hypothetical protein
MYHPRHADILATVARHCPFGEVRVIPRPLRRPCDYAVVVDNSYTVAAPSREGWAEVDAVRGAGFDFSAAYERIFDRDFTDFVLEYETDPDKRRQLLRRREASNALRIAVSAILR